MAGYFHTWTQQTPSGPRIRPAAVPFESRVLPLQEFASLGLPLRTIVDVIPPIESVTAVDHPTAIDRRRPTHQVEQRERHDKVAARVSDPLTARITQVPHDEATAPTFTSPARSVAARVDVTEPRRTINPPAQAIASRVMTTRVVAPAIAPPRRMTAPSPSAPARSRESTAPSGEQAPDIHVHIGRIELTAVTAPAAPRQPSQPASKAMPLNEYLQRRNRSAQ